MDGGKDKISYSVRILSIFRWFQSEKNTYQSIVCSVVVSWHSLAHSLSFSLSLWWWCVWWWCVWWWWCWDGGVWGGCYWAWQSPKYGHCVRVFLAATKQLYKWYFPSVCPSVRLSVCPSVRHTFLTMFPSSYHHEIFRSYYQWPT